ncbi:MAG: glycosyltransferase family 39 protein [Candidatus Omnitrophica bacterium]|nr:glycosyltransferase family 39 protein [Candidatus Omnitrophota bacterium]
MILPAILPLLALGISFFLFLRQTAAWRESTLFALLTCGAWVWGTTEVFSPFRMLNIWNVAFSWYASMFFLLFLIISQDDPAPISPQNIYPAKQDVVVIIGISFILLSTLCFALVFPPNSSNALSYHLSRIAHWAQNSSVLPYPTHIDRQIYSAPWQEYAFLNLYLLCAGDFLINLVPWIATLGSIIAASLIARELGASPRSQLIAAAFAAAIPMGIAQASGTFGDAVAGLWVTCSVFFFLRWKKKPQWRSAIACGTATGLAWLSRPTTAIFLAPLMIWAVSTALRSRQRFSQCLAILAISATIILPFAFNTQKAFSGTPGILDGIMIQGSAIDAIPLNIIRNAGIHWQTPFPTLNEKLNTTIDYICRHFNIPKDDPRTTYRQHHFHFNLPSFAEYEVPNGLHVLLYTILTLFLFSKRIPMSSKKFFLMLASMAILFCLTVRWQQWISRFHLPLFILAAAWAAAIIEKTFLNRLKSWIALGLIAASIPIFLYGYPRNFIKIPQTLQSKREENYLIFFPQISSDQTACAAYTKKINCPNIGLISGDNDREYPLFPLLQATGIDHFRLEHVLVNGPLSNVPYPLGKFDPCAIIVFSGSTNDTNHVTLENKTFSQPKDFPQQDNAAVKILTPEP